MDELKRFFKSIDFSYTDEFSDAIIEKVVFNKSNVCIIASVARSKLVRGNWVTKGLGT